MGTPIVNLDTLIDTRVSANIDVQTTLDAKQEALDAVVDAQAILDSVDNTVSAKKVELDQYTVVKQGELDTHADSLELALSNSVTAVGEGKIDEYDANALNRITQYDDNHVSKLTAYNANDATKLSQYNANHIESLENINYAYADRIVQMLKTKRIYGMMDQYVAQTEEHMIPFLSTDDDNYIYYGNGTLLELDVDYTVYDATTIELVAKANPYDVITQINTAVLSDMLVNENVLFEDRIGAANGVAGLDVNGQIPSDQLPSYVDDVIEVATYADLSVTGEIGKIYVVIADETSRGDTSSYRWTGTVYAMVSNTLTAVDVKELYEANTDTNAYDDAAVAKLAGIEDSATADQTGAEIKALYEAELDTNAYTDASVTKLDVNTALSTIATTLPTAINELKTAVDLNTAKQTNITTDLSYTAGVTEGTIVSSDGTDAVIPAADATNAGLMLAVEKAKLDGIETGATADQTASEVPVTPQGSLSSTNVQSALVELQTDINGLTTIVEW